MLPLAMVFVAYRSRRWKALLLVTACSLPMIAPWMIKNWIYVDNPVAPLANRIFRNPYFHVVTEEVLSQDMRRYSVDNKWTLPVEVTLRGEKTTGLIGPVFLLAPLALLALRERAGRRLLAAGVLLLATYFANIGTRFLIPCLPFFSLAMALPLANFPPLLAAMMIFHAVASWPAVIRLYAPHAWGLDRILYKQALRIIPRTRYLRQNFPRLTGGEVRGRQCAEGRAVLARSGVPEAYTSREILIGYQAAFNESLVDSLDIGWLGSFGNRGFSKPSHFPKGLFAASAWCKPASEILRWSNGASTSCASSITVWRFRAGPNGVCARGPIRGMCSSPSIIPLPRAGALGRPLALGCISMWTSAKLKR